MSFSQPPTPGVFTQGYIRNEVIHREKSTGVRPTSATRRGGLLFSLAVITLYRRGFHPPHNAQQQQKSLVCTQKTHETGICQWRRLNQVLYIKTKVAATCDVTACVKGG